MKTILGTQVPESVDDILHGNNTWSNEFYTWSAENQNDFINCADRAARCHDAAEHGRDGSTHAEHIDDFREYGKELLRRLRKEIGDALDDDEAASNDFDACEVSYNIYCDDLEKWHEMHETLNEQCG